MLKDNETVYDEQIAPMMTKIIQICKDNNLPMFASFAYADGMQCTTSLPPDGIGAETSDHLDKMFNDLKKAVKQSPEVFAFTITTKKD